MFWCFPCQIWFFLTLSSTVPTTFPSPAVESWLCPSLPQLLPVCCRCCSGYCISGKALELNSVSCSTLALRVVPTLYVTFWFINGPDLHECEASHCVSVAKVVPALAAGDSRHSSRIVAALLPELAIQQPFFPGVSSLYFAVVSNIKLSLQLSCRNEMVSCCHLRVWCHEGKTDFQLLRCLGRRGDQANGHLMSASQQMLICPEITWHRRSFNEWGMWNRFYYNFQFAFELSKLHEYPKTFLSICQQMNALWIVKGNILWAERC